MKPQSPASVLSRRHFLSTTAAAWATVSIVPGHFLGLRGATPPSEKLNIAGIGAGGKGADGLGNLASQNIVALADVDWRQAAGSFKKYPLAKPYKDFRRMLEMEDKNIDAVIISIPDHMHAVAAAACMRMKKHVYCEKPLTHDVWEARQLAAIAREMKVATQMGNQGQASEETRRICELVWAGVIGPVRELHIWTDRPNNGALAEYWPQGVARPTDTPPVPNDVDWDLWLGTAPARPYHPAYLPFKWRGWWDFGTGALGDIGCHACDPFFRALKLGAPSTVEAVSTRVNDQTYPLGSMVRYEFPARGEMPSMTLTWYDGGLKPMRPPEFEEGKEWGTNGNLIVGDLGKMTGSKVLTKARQEAAAAVPKSIPRSPGHYVEWIEACKGGKPAGSNFDHAGPLTEMVLLGNVALRVQLREELMRTKLRWDGPAMRFTNLDDANAFLKRDYRPGWSL
jgi:predicted dehydrogenase